MWDLVSVLVLRYRDALYARGMDRAYTMRLKDFEGECGYLAYSAECLAWDNLPRDFSELALSEVVAQIRSVHRFRWVANCPRTSVITTVACFLAI